MVKAIFFLVLTVALCPAAHAQQTFRRGDANIDGKVDLSDAVKTLMILFLGDPKATCDDAMDSNDDGKVDISDPVYLLGFLFLSGKAPPSPFPGCGTDTTGDPLGCDAYPPCPGWTAGCADGVQESGSIYRICLPDPSKYNGRLIIWAHGFQDAGEPVGIPEEQMRFGDITLADLLNDMGFAFATNSYRKTGLAVRQGVEDILDLVSIFTEKHGAPVKTYVTGASEGGIITTLLVEGYPDVFAGGLAACGPVGDWQFQMSFFGNTRALFEFFFPGMIPGDPFDPTPELIRNWEARYESVVKPAILAPANRDKLDQLVATAHLPVDPSDYLRTAEICVEDALRYAVVNLQDAVETLGGFPFDNASVVYSGSVDDERLNREVVRVSADPAAVAEMRARYNTSGNLSRPLMTLHTLLDSQVPYEHEEMYVAKCTASGTEETSHWNFPADRFGHCNFTEEEVLFTFAMLLAQAGDGDLVEGLGAAIDAESLAAFER